MITSRARAVLALLIGAGCSPGQKSLPADATVPVEAAPSTRDTGKHNAVIADSDVRHRSGRVPSTGKTSKPAVPSAGNTRKTISPEELIASLSLSGHIVAVEGKCGGYLGSVEPPPVSRSDWLLVGKQAAVYVVGEAPSDCSSVSGGQALVTVVGEVASDSIRTPTGYRKRIYLLRSR
jgi:hypothetical protein